MKRAVWIAFGFLALFAAIVLPLKSKAAPPFMPLAVCDKGVCTMKEADYNQLRDFHQEVLQAAQTIMHENKMMENALAEMKQELARHAFCQGRRT